MFLLLLGATLQTADDDNLSLQSGKGNKERERRTRPGEMYERTHRVTQTCDCIKKIHAAAIRVTDF